MGLVLKKAKRVRVFKGSGTGEPTTPEELAARAFTWIAKGIDTSGHVTFRTYSDAVRLGYVGHRGMWYEFVLATGEMTRADFPDAPGYRNK